MDRNRKKNWNKTIRRILWWIVCISLILPYSTRVYGQEMSKKISIGESNGESIKKSINETAQSLQKTVSGGKSVCLRDAKQLPPGASSSDWTAMVLAFSGVSDAYDAYLENLEAYVIRQYEANGCLDTVKTTEYARIALTMLALGGDPTKIREKETTINLIQEGIFRFPREALDLQGANGLVYGLLTVDAFDYTEPKDAKFTREYMIEQLLTYQWEDGSFGIGSNGRGDVDITAMALQALAPYLERQDVKQAVDSALNWLSQSMTETGTFVSYGNESAEATAQVILALCALGMDPEEDPRFCKELSSGERKTPLDGLASFRMTNGMYMHTRADGEENVMATYQGLLALEAVDRLQTEGKWIFDFQDYRPPESTHHFPVIATIGAAAVILVIGVTAAGIRKNRKKQNAGKNQSD